MPISNRRSRIRRSGGPRLLQLGGQPVHREVAIVAKDELVLAIENAETLVEMIERRLDHLEHLAVR